MTRRSDVAIHWSFWCHQEHGSLKNYRASSLMSRSCKGGRPSSSAVPDEEGRGVVRLEELNSVNPDGDAHCRVIDRRLRNTLASRGSTGRRSRVHHSEINANTGNARLWKKTVRTRSFRGSDDALAKHGSKPQRERSPAGCGRIHPRSRKRPIRPTTKPTG